MIDPGEEIYEGQIVGEFTPDVSEELTMTAKTRESLTPCTFAFSAGLWASVRSMVPPM